VFSAGTRLGPYDILGLVGAGGMGDVYRAQDTRLDRRVALKISREQFTPRFENEARATAALEHPHICRLYDICHESGVSFLVMEYVEGTPLTGPLPLDQALLYAGQIASALDAAHRKQIVHRDLKPANILVTPKGGVKLLDFGLAKLGRDDTPLDDATLTRGLTAAGTIVGTLHYMSPEQLQGAVADARSDIFAFGLVLYEMLTGKRAFDGASAASIIAAILERPAPSISEVAPPSLDRLLHRCLAKDPEERWQSARDIKAALDLVVQPPISVHAAPELPIRHAPLWPWLVAAATATALAGLAFVHFRESPLQPETVRFQIPAPEGTRTAAPVLSPNGQLVAFVALDAKGGSRVWVRRLDGLETRSLPGTENATENIFWSPDSRLIAFSADRKLKTIEATGGGLRTLADLPGNPGGGAWNDEGVIVVSGFRAGLFRLSAAGGSPVQLTTPSENDVIHVLPSFLPDGHLLYGAVQRDRRMVARVVAIDGSQIREFPIDTGSRIVYVPPHSGRRGHLLFNRGDALVAQPVEDTTFAPTGEPVQVVDSVADVAVVGAAPGFYSVSSTGTLAYLSGAIVHPTQLTWFDRTGRELGVVGPEAIYNDLSLSPDETRVAMTRRDGPNDDIWIVDLARNVPTRFTFDAAQDWHPVWSPDGSRLAFSSTRLAGGRTNSLFWKDAINIGGDETVFKSPQNERLDDWSPDGKFLLINRTDGRDDLWILPVDPGSPGKSEATPYLNSQTFSETRGQFFPVNEPDGRLWIVYTSNESGENEIYVESFPRGSQKERISTAGGTQPRWRRDGKELFYISPDLKLMGVDVRLGTKLEFGTPHELFQTRLSLNGTLPFRMLRYDVTRDGKRFLINSERGPADAIAPPITVVLNWTAMLK